MKQMDKTKRIIQQPTTITRTNTNTTVSPSTSMTESPGSRRMAMRLPGWVLMPLRLFLAITFIYAGIQKLADPHYFDPSAAGYIGKQIQAFATGSPLHTFLINVAVPHANLFGALVAYGEIGIGVATLLGLLSRPAAIFGLLLSLMFFLSASWRVYPYFYGADIVFVFCWITLLIAGPVDSWIPAYDMVLVPRLLAITAEEWRAGMAQILYVLLGVRVKATPALSATDRSQGRPTAGNYRGRIAWQAQTTRRNFLWGLVTGGGGMLAILWLAQNLKLLPQSATETATAVPGDTATAVPTNAAPASVPANPPAATPTGGTSGSSMTIARVSAVPTNSAVNFTIPSNGDPGVLVHLNNGKFVAFDATCTHAGCPVQYDPSSKYLLCPCHGAVFDPANAAAVIQGPTNTPLSSVPINLDNATGTISTSG
jgi:thiosulfate dehydrogenase (quinone) large subunit